MRGGQIGLDSARPSAAPLNVSAAGAQREARPGAPSARAGCQSRRGGGRRARHIADCGLSVGAERRQLRAGRSGASPRAAAPGAASVRTWERS